MGTCVVCRFFFFERETDPFFIFLTAVLLSYVVEVRGHIQAHTYELDSLNCLIIMMIKKIMMMMPVA